MARTLEVSARTVYRDIAALQAQRVPIEGDAGVGYLMRRGYDLPPLMFTAEEVEAIAVGLSLLRRTGDRGLAVSAESVTRKIGAALPEGRGGAMRGDGLYASSWGAEAPESVDLAHLRAAIRDERKLRIAYRDEQERRTDRVIQPFALVYYVEVVILVGHCELRGAFRHFRVDRIEACDEACDEGAGAFDRSAEEMRAEWLADRSF